MVYGKRKEGVGCPFIDTGFFSSMVKKNIIAGFCGHDHVINIDN
jgi:hypothetical protein